jgi:hypothetical protein
MPLAMTDLIVSLDVISNSLSLSVLIEMFGASTSSGSFTQGELSPRGTPRKCSLLRFESSAAESATCEEHIATLRCDLERIAARLEGRENIDITLLLNIGLFFATANGSVDFESLRLRSAHVPLRISVTAYPVSEAVMPSLTHRA